SLAGTRASAPAATGTDRCLGPATAIRCDDGQWTSVVPSLLRRDLFRHQESDRHREQARRRITKPGAEVGGFALDLRRDLLQSPPQALHVQLKLFTLRRSPELQLGDRLIKLLADGLLQFAQDGGHVLDLVLRP